MTKNSSEIVNSCKCPPQIRENYICKEKKSEHKFSKIKIKVVCVGLSAMEGKKQSGLQQWGFRFGGAFREG